MLFVQPSEAEESVRVFLEGTTSHAAVDGDSFALNSGCPLDGKMSGECLMVESSGDSLGSSVSSNPFFLVRRLGLSAGSGFGFNGLYGFSPMQVFVSERLLLQRWRGY